MFNCTVFFPVSFHLRYFNLRYVFIMAKKVIFIYFLFMQPYIKIGNCFSDFLHPNLVNNKKQQWAPCEEASPCYVCV